MSEKEPRNEQSKGTSIMTTTTRRSTTTSGAIFQWRSLRTRVTLLTLAIFVIGIWVLAFYASETLHRDMEQTLSDQQFSTVSIVAADINDALEDRSKLLTMIAAKITPTMLGNAAATQTFLDSHISLKILFNYGGIVMRPDGTAIAETPNYGRIGLNYSERDFVIEALKGKTVIGKPVMGKTSQSPILSCAAPIRDARGKVIGVVAGITDLSKPNFLNKITDHGYGKTGGYLLVSPKIRTVVFATDKKRIMEVLPAPGINPLIDRFIQGYEGSGITVRPSDGMEILSSAKGIPVSGWYLAALISTEEAFAPVHALQKRVLLATVLLTLLSGVLTLWMLKRQLAPIFTTIKALTTLSDTDQPPASLPITRHDEIGELIGGFNHLLETLGKRGEALRVSEERYQSLFEQAGDGIFILDATGKILSINNSFASMHGFTVEEMLTMGLDGLDVQGTAPVPERIRRVMDGETLSFEVEHYHKDGHTFPLSVTANLVSAGNEQLIIANHRDLTEKKRTEEALTHSYDLMRYIIEHNRSAIAVHDKDLNYIYVSQRYLDDYKVKEKDVIGKHHYDVFPDLPQKWRDVHQKAMAGEILSAEDDPYEREDGAVDWTRWECRPWYASNGSIGGIIVYTEIVTERKRMEEAIRLSRGKAERLAEEMATLANIGRVIGSTLDIDEVYERFAAEAKRLIPFDRITVYLHNIHEGTVKVAYVSGEEIIGRHRGDSFPLKNSMSDLLIKTREGLLDYPKTIEEVHQKFHDHNATTLDAVLPSLARVPLIYRNEVIGALLFGSKTPNAYTKEDLHLAERIGAQIAGAIGNAQLFNDLSKTEKSLRESEERLQRAEKMEALGQLAGGVAHDLNNVLGIMSGYSELLLEEIPEGNRSRDHVEKILNSTRKGAAIIEDLLTLARRGVTTSSVINLSRIVPDFLQTPVFEKIKEHHPRVTFRIDCDDNLLNINGSPVHLEKTLMNLVSNAAEAISGKGEVTIKTESRYLDKPLQAYDEIKEGDYAVLAVSDTGMGVPAEDMQKIFEPFYTKKKMGRSGTGLGLAIVWGTVKDHSGYIDIQTEIGKGTTFTLYFPVTREEMTAPQQKVPIGQYIGTGESVLVVDDIAEQREIATKLITLLGYQVHAVSSGEDAVEYLKENKADILVLDMIMTPGIDGLETYQRVLAVNPKQKVILVSGFSETERVGEAQKLGAGAYVKKPYALEKIGVAIRDELNRK